LKDKLYINFCDIAYYYIPDAVLMSY